AALPADGGVLLERYELAHLPSASALPALRLGRSSTRASLALFADPIYDGSELGRLDGSRREAEELRRLDGVTVEAHLGAQARRDAVLGDRLRDHRYLHFAAHATFDGERPELSSLVLSLADADGRPLDGHLRLGDISAMSLGAELVVLSGCDTGLGRDLRGEGLLGLARAFFYAGAGRVASSLWRVEDGATAELMTRFYRHLLGDGLPPSAALRRAQLDLRQGRRYRHPFFWSAFVIQGDWLPATPPESR
ncbi:MAG: CHAT domain-containing protein, partial [Acidobacteriota bacterium]